MHIWSHALSPDGELLAVGLSDGGLAIWNLAQVRSQLDKIGLGWKTEPAGQGPPALEGSKAEPTAAQRYQDARAHLGHGQRLLSYSRLQEAELSYRRAGEILEALAADSAGIPEYRQSVAETHAGLGNLLFGKGDFGGAAAAYRKAIDLNPKEARAHSDLARLLATCPDPKLRDPRQAVRHAQTATELAPKEGQFWYTLAVARTSAGDWAGVAAAYRQALALSPFGPDHPVTLNMLHGLAIAYQQSGNLPEAIRLFKQVRDRRLEKLGPNDPQTLSSMNYLAVAYWQARQYDRAVPVLEEAVRLYKAKYGAENYWTQNVVANLAVNYRDAGRPKEAIPLLEEVVAWARRQPAPQQQDFAWVPGALADAYERDQQFAKAEPVSRAALGAARRQFGAADPRTVAALANLGWNLLEQKKYAEAEPLLRECLAAREKAIPDAWPTFNAKSMLGGCLLGQKKYADAEPLLLKGYQGMKQRETTMPPPARPRLPEAVERLVRLYDEWGKKDEAARWRKELEARKKAPQKKKG